MSQFALPEGIASSAGVVDRDGVRLTYAVSGESMDHPVTILLLPTWSIIPARFWKAQVPVPVPPLPRRDVRRARQRRLGSPRGSRRLHQRGVCGGRARGARRHGDRPRRRRRALLRGAPGGSTWPRTTRTGSAGSSPSGRRAGSTSRHPTATPTGGATESTAPEAGRSTTSTTGSRATTTTSSGSSSPSCSPSRTPPSRSRTASAGRTRSPRRRWPTRPPAGSASTARCASGSSRSASGCSAPSSSSTAPRTTSARTPTASGSPS